MRKTTAPTFAVLSIILVFCISSVPNVFSGNNSTCGDCTSYFYTSRYYCHEAGRQYYGRIHPAGAYETDDRAREDFNSPHFRAPLGEWSERRAAGVKEEDEAGKVVYIKILFRADDIGCRELGEAYCEPAYIPDYADVIDLLPVPAYNWYVE